MELDEPNPQAVERVVRTLKLVLKLIDRDPLASGGKAVVEAFYGRNLESELEEWLKNPREKWELRNRFVLAMEEIWNSEKMR